MRNVRTAVFVLVFANLVFMAWAHWIDAPREAPANPSDARLPRLVLLSEAPARPREANRPPVVSATSAPSEAPVSAAALNSRRCVSVGPFNELAQETHAAS